ncbi:hypothetical protein BH10PLA2_BH10PLA2_27320 [soil metagenome]
MNGRQNADDKKMVDKKIKSKGTKIVNSVFYPLLLCISYFFVANFFVINSLLTYLTSKQK